MNVGTGALARPGAKLRRGLMKSKGTLFFRLAHTGVRRLHA